MQAYQTAVQPSSAPSKLPPTTPHEQACGEPTSHSAHSTSCSTMSTSGSFTSASGSSARKRKAASESKPISIRIPCASNKHRAADRISALEDPTSCESDHSSDDCMLSWSQSYAASRGLTSQASASQEGQQSHATHGLLCREEGLEMIDDELQACRTSYSTLSSSSSQSDTFLLDASLSGDGFDYPEDPPQALDLEKYELPMVPPSSLSHSLAAVYGFSPHVIAFGTTFLQRLAARDPYLLRSASRCPDFAPFVQGITPQKENLLHKSIGHPTHTWQSEKIWCMAVHLTCIYLAAKSVEMVPYKRLLQTMLTHVHERAVTREQAAALEMEVIQGLDWRLSPYMLAPARQQLSSASHPEDDLSMLW